MVNAGSKGSTINIAQMISCLGQQNVDGKTYSIWDLKIELFLIIQNLMIVQRLEGLLKVPLFKGLRQKRYSFMQWVVVLVLIDTAVKTSQTGYIQRRLIKVYGRS